MKKTTRRGCRPARDALVRIIALLAFAAGFAGIPGQAAGQQAEQARIAELLEIEDGSHVADIGAGEGEWTRDLARRVGPSGRVYATEIDSERLQIIREAVSAAGLDNVTVQRGAASRTNLPGQCCDAILLRRVYHHLAEPAAMTRSMFQTLRPGGRILVIDFSPTERARPEGVPAERGGHGAPIDQVRREMTAAGFEFLRRIEDWPGREGDFALLFRRPPSS